MAYQVYVKLKNDPDNSGYDWLSICKSADVMTQGKSATDAAYMMIDALRLLLRGTEFDMEIGLQHMEISAKSGVLYISVDSENKWEKFCESRLRPKKSKKSHENQSKKPSD